MRLFDSFRGANQILKARFLKGCFRTPLFRMAAASAISRRRRSSRPLSIELLECRTLLSGDSVTSSLQVAPPPQPHDSASPAAGLEIEPTRMLRAYNPNAGVHVFTTSVAEFSIIVGYGLTDEATNNPGFNVNTQPGNGADPLHRLYNPNNGSHYLTMSDGERDALVSIGWVFERDDGFAFSTAVPGAGLSEVFHIYNNRSGDHFFTTSMAEVTAAVVPGGDWVVQTSLGFAFADPNPLALPGFAQGTQLSAGMDGGVHRNDVEALLDRADAQSVHKDAVIAVVDRNGTILGVRVQTQVPALLAGNTEKLVFSVDGAVSVARTAAFFSSDEAPLPSRTVRFISQSTLTQSEVESDPNLGLGDPNLGPGFVGPIGLGGHFPPEVNETPPVDLFAIEHTNRDSLLMPGLDGVKGTPDDVPLNSRFNAQFIPGKEIKTPESFGLVSGLLPTAQSRGIGTLPGGIPLFRKPDPSSPPKLIGGIGVFFPGPDGYASYEQGFVPHVGQTEEQRTNASRVLEAEYIAFAAAGGSFGAELDGVPGAKIGPIAGIPPIGTDLPFGRIDLVGITLQSVGPTAGKVGISELVEFGSTLGVGIPDGIEEPVKIVNTAAGPVPLNYLSGQPVPEEWLVAPKSSALGNISAADVTRIIQQGIDEANKVRAAIRLPLGQRTRMVFAVADQTGEVLGLYRMKDATFFSIDVAVAKSRNTEYYADPAKLTPVDQVPTITPGVAFTNRTFRFLAEPRYPSGIEGQVPPFSVLNEAGIDRETGEDIDGHVNVFNFQSVVGFDGSHVGRNFRNGTDSLKNQNGIVFFPGSIPLYVNSGATLIGGFGVSGDGVDQDDVVTFYGASGYFPNGTTVLRADQTSFIGTNLPFIKFLRNPHA